MKTNRAMAGEIEKLRIQLKKLVVEKRFDFQDSEVLLLSQELDCLIVKFQKSLSIANSDCEKLIR